MQSPILQNALMKLNKIGCFSDRILENREALSFFSGNDTLSFLSYVTNVPVPQLNREMLVVMDNPNLHTTDAVRKAIEDTGAKLVFLPTYSPDLSPIEMFWSKVKLILRSIAPRTTEELHAAITAAFNSISISNLFGWFYECDARTVPT